MNPGAVPVDASDPLVAVAAWAISWALNRYLGRRAKKYRHAVPTVAILVAVALRGAYAYAQGQPFDVGTVLRAVAAGAVAVAGHSQFREIGKAFEKPEKTIATAEKTIATAEKTIEDRKTDPD